MDNTPPSGKKKKKRIEDVVEEELLAVLQGNVLVGREERGAQALVKPIGQGEDRQTNPLVRGRIDEQTHWSGVRGRINKRARDSHYPPVPSNVAWVSLTFCVEKTVFLISVYLCLSECHIAAMHTYRKANSLVQPRPSSVWKTTRRAPANTMRRWML